MKEILRPLLTHNALEFAEDRGRVLPNWTRKRLYGTSQDNQLVMPVGCVPRVVRELENAGYVVEVFDHRGLDRESLELDCRDIAEGEANCPGITACMEKYTEGLLVIPRGQRRARTIGAMCRLLSKARIFVAAATFRVAQETAAELGHFVGGAVQAVRGGDWSSPCRVVCGTFTSFDRSRACDWDVLIYEDGQEALGVRGYDNRGSFGQHRVYACVEPPANLTKQQQLELETLAGPIIYHDRGKRPQARLLLEAVFASVPDEHFPVAKLPRDQREQIWTAPRRNHTIAGIAEACAAANSAQLWDRGLCVGEADPFRRWPRTPRVTMLVESPRHADILARLLPDWTVLTRRPPAAGSPAGWEGLSQRAVPNRSIITAVRAEEFKAFGADVIVMAAGGPWPLLPRGLSRREGQVLVIDFDDSSTPSLIKDTASRRRQYEKIVQNPIY